MQQLSFTDKIKFILIGKRATYNIRYKLAFTTDLTTDNLAGPGVPTQNINLHNLLHRHALELKKRPFSVTISQSFSIYCTTKSSIGFRQRRTYHMLSKKKTPFRVAFPVCVTVFFCSNTMYSCPWSVFIATSIIFIHVVLHKSKKISVFKIL